MSQILFVSQLGAGRLQACFKGCRNHRRNIRKAATHHVGVSLPGLPFPAHVNCYHVRKRLLSLAGLAHDPADRNGDVGSRASGGGDARQSSRAEPSASSSSSVLCPAPAAGVVRAAPAAPRRAEGTHVPPGTGHCPAPTQGCSALGGPRPAREPGE